MINTFDLCLLYTPCLGGIVRLQEHVSAQLDPQCNPQLALTATQHDMTCTHPSTACCNIRLQVLEATFNWCVYAEVASRPTWLAANTTWTELEDLLSVLELLCKKQPTLLTVLGLDDLTRSAPLQQLLQSHGLNTLLWSQMGSTQPQVSSPGLQLSVI